MKLIQTLIVASLMFALTVPALQAANTAPIHLFNRLRIGYDDNVYQGDDSAAHPKQDSFRIIEELQLMVNLNLQRTYLGLRYQPSVIWYSDREEDDIDFLHNLDVNFIHNFSPSLTLSLSDTLRYSQLPELVDGDYLVRSNDDNLVNSFFATLSYRIQPTTRIDLSGRSVMVRYLNDADTEEDNNYYTIVGGLTVRQQLASLTTVNADLRYQVVTYDEAAVGRQRDSESIFAGLGLEQTFVPQLIGTFRAGVEARTYELDAYDDQTEPYGEASLTFLPSPSTRITAAASYSIYESDVANYLAQNRTYLSLSLAHDFTARLSFYLSSGFTLSNYEADYALDRTLEDADENSYLVSARLAYRVGRINWLEAGWQFVKLDSDVRNRVEYDRNRFDIGWKVQLF